MKTYLTVTRDGVLALCELASICTVAVDDPTSRKVRMIRLLRNILPIGLREAKNLVEAYQAHSVRSPLDLALDDIFRDEDRQEENCP